MYNATLDFAGNISGEQMAMGSSPGSPVNIPSPNTSQFLPGYLMGDLGPSPVTMNPRMWPLQGSLSPTKIRAGPFPTPGSSPVKSLFSPSVQLPNVLPVSSNRNYHRQTSEKHGGPPIHGLFDHPSTPTHTTTINTTMSPLVPNANFFTSTPGGIAVPSDKISSPVTSPNFSQDLKFPPSPAQLDPFYSQRESLKADDQLDECWVTVFGFPPAAASYVLQQFYHYGNIVDNKMAPSGNWMHIRYQTKLQAKIALSKNGKVFSGNIMVGVTPCIDKSVMDSQENVSRLIPESLDATANTSVKNSTPVNVAYKFASSEHSVKLNGSVPQKSTGLVSKAMEYLFGW